MASLLPTLLLLAFLTITLAAPSPQHASIQKRSFKVERVPNPKFRRTPGAGTRALIKAHRKYSVSLPPGLVAAMNAQKGGQASGTSSVQAAKGAAGGLAALEGALGAILGEAGKGAGAASTRPQPSGAGSGPARGSGAAASGRPLSTGTPGQAGRNGTAGAARGSGRAPASPQSTGTPGAANKNNTAAGVGLVAAIPEGNDVEYLSPVTIGGQTVTLDFDSGSSDLWVFNTQLSAAAQAGHQNFDVSKSTSFQMLQGETFTISYGDGSGAAGLVGVDTVDIGGATVTFQAIELATAVSQSFIEDTANNGLVGLGFSKLNAVKPTQQKTFFDNAIPTLTEPVFTADLRAQAPGAYEFGRIDKSKFTGDLQWTAINTTQGFWQFSSESASVNGQTTANPGGQAIADTGTTLMLMAPAVVSAYYSQVQGAANDQQVGGVVFPCSATLPDLNVAVGNNMAVIRGKDINFAPVDNANTTCFGGVQAISGDLQVYGDIMFKSQFVVFNGGNNSIGMALHA